MANDTPGSIPPLKPEDNPAVGIVTPDDYPEGRKNANLEAGRDDDLKYERDNPSSGTDPQSE